MSELKYPQCIEELYQSEVLGEQAFLALLAVARNKRDKYHFGTLLQLESETKVRLRPFLQKYELDFVEAQAGGELVGGMVTAYTENSWLEFLASLKPLVEQFLARFQAIADAGPVEDQEILQSMVTHEQSFVEWIDKETDGEDGALDLAISQLEHPLSPP